ncbi:MAG: hypothetical protein FD130_1837 [Halothiobacillaceae bacterium]|nr:MAG: hypothetical protein FD130_1837 [Halothiobacillaceae bacterium]
MAAALQGHTLFITLVSGQRVDNGLQYYSPGDLFFETSSGRYGVEIGGGAGGGAGSAIYEGDAGSTYTLNSSGYTLSHANAAATQVAGSVWKNGDWILDPLAPSGPVQLKINAGSQLVGTADYIFTRNTVTSQHAIIELALDTRMFNGDLLNSMHWRPSCGNDEMNVRLNLQTVPEPNSLWLMGAGLGLVAWVARRRSLA